MKRRPLIGLLIAIAVGASACSGSDPERTPTPSPVVSSTADSASPTTSSTSPTVGTDPNGAPDGDPPTDAVVDGFCAAYRVLVEPTDTGTAEDAVVRLKDAADRLRRVGTPADIPDEGRAGLLVLVGLFAALPDDATPAQLDRVGDGLSTADQESFIALTTYAATACPSPAA